MSARRNQPLLVVFRERESPLNVGSARLGWPCRSLVFSWVCAVKKSLHCCNSTVYLWGRVKIKPTHVAR
ncbi:Uncharacterised protein [Vibrio cholerae]|nr:Uncharacterised protein [Vibrio cholerae]